MNRDSRGFTIIEAMVSVAILLILVGIIFGSIANIYRATSFSDNIMIVNTQNSRALGIIREDMLQTSNNFSGQYAPFIHGGTSELRFRKINGFDTATGRSTYANKYICYHHDSTLKFLYRRVRDLSENLLEQKAVGECVTVFTPVIDTDAGNVTITLITSKGTIERNDDATTTRTVILKPFNID